MSDYHREALSIGVGELTSLYYANNPRVLDMLESAEDELEDFEMEQEPSFGIEVME